MNIRGKSLLIWIPLGIWLAVSVVYYCWLVSRISYSSENRASLSFFVPDSPPKPIFRPPSGYQSNTLKRRASHSLVKFINYQLPQVHYDSSSICEVIHVTLICMYKCTRNVTPMLKSLLHHRQSPIYFHIIVDNNSRPIFDKLFETWDLPDVNYSLYNAESYFSYVQWIPNTHYSGKYACIKVLIPDILPQTLKRVIHLDSDLTILTDIAELWALFKNMTDDQLLGLIQNESDWYLKHVVGERMRAYVTPLKRWPALGRGYNTGVMLLDLEKIRSRGNWTHMWSEVVYENINKLKSLHLADQDIINAVIKKHRRIVFNISCQYNVQLSIKSLAKFCYGDVKNAKVIHWSSPRKYNIHIEDSDFFRNIHQSYVNFDIKLLRRKLHTCWAKATYAQ